MSFAHPWVLLFLAVPALLLWAIPARRAAVAMPFDHQAHARRRTAAILLGAFECVPPLLLAGAILLLAGPQMLRTPRDARELTNIQFCLDVSGSMAWENRYSMAKEAIEKFVAAREGDAFGMTLFGTYQIRWTPLTTDLSAILAALPFADPTRQPRHMGGTRIGAALRFCRDNMIAEAERGDRMIILVSDGESFDLGNGEEQEIGEELRAAGIVVYHIHIAEEDIPQAVVEIAQITGGEAFQANDPQSLQAVFRHIDRMRPARFRTMGTVPMDHFGPIALGCLALLGVHLVGLAGIRYTPW
ncbi:MAG TPA: vWA domain-containing protein [Phycisphaerales bacterium]|nr:vWA domain-containing protein [Phycisphaerales bacterium]HMP36348.1 vWA domain-containing protein [Phycisphaerales bacterium]